MRLARLTLAGLALGIIAGFIAALLRPRPRLVDQPIPIQSLTQGDEQPIGWGTRPERPARSQKSKLPPLVPVVPKAPPQGPVV
jgi:hypothetical protein